MPDEDERVKLYKTGPHVLAPTVRAVEWARRAPIVKVIDNAQLLRDLESEGRYPTTVFRHCFQPPQGGGCFNQDLNRRPGEVADEILEALGGYVPTYVELYNELAWSGQDLRLHVDLVEAVTRELKRRESAIKVAGFSWSTGTPSEESWYYLGHRGFGGVDAVAIHEYWGEQGFTREHGLRHRQLHDWMYEHPPFLITECGRDQIEGGGRGWLLGGTPLVSVYQYAQELIRYDEELRADDYVIGACVFAAGASLSGWADFDTDYSDGTNDGDLMVQIGVRFPDIGPGECDEAGSWGRYQETVCDFDQGKQCYQEINACTGATRIVDCRVVPGLCGAPAEGGGGGGGGGGGEGGGGGGGGGGGTGGGESPLGSDDVALGVGALLLALLLLPAGK